VCSLLAAVWHATEQYQAYPHRLQPYRWMCWWHLPQCEQVCSSAEILRDRITMFGTDGAIMVAFAPASFRCSAAIPVLSNALSVAQQRIHITFRADSRVRSKSHLSFLLLQKRFFVFLFHKSIFINLKSNCIIKTLLSWKNILKGF
jgi:hypothetical protein